MRNVFLKTLPLEVAIQTVRDKAPIPTRIEQVPLSEALHRITAEPLFARLSNPNYNAAAMDGIAVIAEHTTGAMETAPKRLSLGQDYQWVNTGHVLKHPYNAVIMVEDVEQDGAEALWIRQSAYPWQHVRMVGEDIAIGDMIVPSGRRLGPLELGALASAGILEVPVLGRLTVGIIPTGSEIVTDLQAMTPGAIMESNSYMFKGLIEEAGHLAIVYPVVKDVQALLTQAVQSALDTCDMVVINAGSSAGSEDYTRSILESLGELHFHGIDIKPGKPTLFATAEGKAIFGIPGYPVSAFVAFDALVMPLLLPQEAETFQAQLTKPLVSSLKHEEFVRVQVGRIGDRLVATPLARGAGATMSLVKANGILRIPRALEGYPAGTQITVTALHQRRPFESALLAIGSHDLVMDLLEDLAPEPFSVLSSHVGSLGGLLALKRGECHIAPTHLLEADGHSYNLSFVRRYFPDEPMVLIKAIQREQGFYLTPALCQTLVAQGLLSPIDTAGFAFKLEGPLSALLQGRSLVNRQKGSGTRLLLDASLAAENIDPSHIEGYSLEMLTHTAVALAVQNGTADLGMGIAAAAERMDLCFVPIALEDYDFLARPELIASPMGQTFLALLGSDGFQKALTALKGYRLNPIALQRVEPEV